MRTLHVVPKVRVTHNSHGNSRIFGRIAKIVDFIITRLPYSL